MIKTRKAHGDKVILDDVTLAFYPGAKIGVVGPNGAGKSTLFNLISGRFHADSGKVLLEGREITRQRPFEINRLGLARSFQITNIFPRLSVFEHKICLSPWFAG